MADVMARTMLAIAAAMAHSYGAATAAHYRTSARAAATAKARQAMNVAT